MSPPVEDYPPPVQAPANTAPVQPSPALTLVNLRQGFTMSITV